MSVLIQRMMWELLGKGTFGQVYGHGSEAGKVLKLREDKALEFEDNCAGMIVTSFREWNMMASLQATEDLSRGWDKSPNKRKREPLERTRFRGLQVRADMQDMVLKMPLLPETLTAFCKRLRHPKGSEVPPEKIKKVLALLKGLVSEMALLDEHGFLHRDLKSDNVMIKHGGHPVVIDYSASGSKAVTQPWAQPVSLYYRAPELFHESPGKYGTDLDLWSLGVLSFNLLCFGLEQWVPKQMGPLYDMQEFAALVSYRLDLTEQEHVCFFGSPRIAPPKLLVPFKACFNRPELKGIPQDLKDFASHLLNPDRTKRSSKTYPELLQWLETIEINP